jgi:hypothetical protein
MHEKISPQLLAAEFENIIRSMPDRKTFRHDLPENHEWLGQAAALVMMADTVRGTVFRHQIDKLYSIGGDPAAAVQSIIITLQQCRSEWRLKSGGPLTVAFEPGKQFDYFDEIRKILASATSDVFVVDPYAGAEFVGRYIPHVKKGVAVRMLVENQITQVRSAAEMFTAQHGTAIEVRKSKSMHDRFIFIDRLECYTSGATFKDGAVKSATLITQITDAFAPMLRIYEDMWSAATP